MLPQEDGHTNDTQTARDMNAFLRRWFAKYSEFSEHDFYVSGEPVRVMTLLAIWGERCHPQSLLRLLCVGRARPVSYTVLALLLALVVTLPEHILGASCAHCLCPPVWLAGVFPSCIAQLGGL